MTNENSDTFLTRPPPSAPQPKKVAAVAVVLGSIGWENARLNGWEPALGYALGAAAVYLGYVAIRYARLRLLRRRCAAGGHPSWQQLGDGPSPEPVYRRCRDCGHTERIDDSDGA